MDKNKKLEKESDLNQEDEGAQDKLKDREFVPFFWVKNLLVTRQKREAALQASREALYRKDIEEGRVAKLKGGEIEAVHMSVKEAEAGDVTDGVDMGEFDVLTFLKAYVEKREVGINTYSPNMGNETSLVRSEARLLNAELIGLELGRMFVAQFPKSVPVLVTNDMGFASSSDSASKYRENALETMRNHHIISESSSFRDVSTTELIAKAPLLVERLSNDPKLAQKGNISTDGNTIIYTIRVPYMPTFREIVLRDSDGKWTREALDIALYMDEIERDSCQVVARLAADKEEQGRAWEILSILGLKPENCHNIYYGENLDPGHVADVVARKIADGLEKFAIEKKESL